MMGRPLPPLTVLTLIIAAIGLVDAAVGRTWDVFALFVVVAVLQIAVLLSTAGNRVTVSLRPDLARWASQRSHRTGEPLDDVIDRSVAWFQHGLYGSQPGDDN